MYVKLIKHNLKFIRPAGTSRGTLLNKPAWYLLFNENNKAGYGEISRLPGLSFDDNELFEPKLMDVIKDINAGTSIGQILNDLKAWPSIRFAVQTGIKDLNTVKGKHYETDFSKGVNGIPINGLIWMGDKDFILAQINEKLVKGFKCLKMKIGALNFKTELAILKSIRKNYSQSDLELRVDANGAFNSKNVYSVLKDLHKLKIHSIEQPIKAGQYDQMKDICKNTDIPIALDEELIGIYDFDNKMELLKNIQPQYIILKPGLLGGTDLSDEWIKIAEKLNIGYWITSALESNIGLNAISQWTATKLIGMHQGLGTGSLYSNNIKSPLEIRGEKLFYDPNKKFDFSKLS